MTELCQTLALLYITKQIRFHLWYAHCPRTVSTPYFISAPDWPVDTNNNICKPHIGRKIVCDTK